MPCDRPSTSDPERGPADPAQARLFGRHKGKRLRAGQQALMETLLPALRVAPASDANLSLEPLFPNQCARYWLEIGYGGGEHLAAQAEAHRDVGILGCEFFENGIAKLLRRIDASGLDNVRLHDGDARAILTALPAASLDRVFLLFPDPWPKTRHHKRRFIQPETLDAIARVLAPGGEFRVASDIPAYVRWTLGHVWRHDAFDWCDEGPSDWRVRRPDWPATRYEGKALRAGRRCAYLTFRRRG